MRYVFEWQSKSINNKGAKMSKLRYNFTMPEAHYRYFLAKGRLFQMFPYCTGVWDVDKDLFLKEKIDDNIS